MYEELNEKMVVELKQKKMMALDKDGKKKTRLLSGQQLSIQVTSMNG